MKKNRWMYIGLIIFLLVSAVIFSKSFFVILAILLIATSLVSTLMNLLIMRQIKIQLILPEIGQKDKDVEGKIIIVSTIHFIGFELACHLNIKNMLNGEVMEEEYHFIAGGMEDNFPIAFASKYCGCLEVMVDNIRVCDVWGVIQLRKKVNVKRKVNIMPEIFKQQITIQHAESMEADGDNSKIVNVDSISGEMFDVRDYRQGDSLKNIHWKLTGKYDDMIVKRVSKEMEQSVVLLFETSYEEKPLDKFIDSAAETFMSISQNLMEGGICHIVAWYEHTNDRFLSFAIDNQSDAAGLVPKILSAGIEKDRKNVMDHYREQYGSIKESHIVCVEACENSHIYEQEITERGIITVIRGSDNKIIQLHI